MKVIICGAGQVGYHIASYLASEQNDVTVIDQAADLIARVNESLDVQAFVGNASLPDVLENAGAADADMIIAVTFADEVNMVACQVAHSLFNVPTKIARIRQHSFLEPVWADLFSREHLPIDVIISPEIEVAQAISRRLAVPGAFDMIPLAEDKVRVIGVRCTADCPIVNTPLRQLTELFPDLHIVVVGIVHEENAFIPKSTDQMVPGDEVYFVADTEHVPRALAAFGYQEQEAHRMVIIGGHERPRSREALLRDLELGELKWMTTREHAPLDVFEADVTHPDTYIVVLMIRWISHFKSAPRRLFLTHGEEAVALKLATEISQKLGYQTHVPEYREVVELT